MDAFAALIEELDQITGTKRKIDLIAGHLQRSDAHDAAWSVLLLMGERRKRLITGRRLRDILQQASAMPDWLFDDCQSHVGDSAETLSLLWPQLSNDIPARIHNPAVTTWVDQLSSSPPLYWWMEELLPAVAAMEPDQQSNIVLAIWESLPCDRLFLFNKLLTGGFRIGVARGLVVKAIATGFQLEEALVLERLMTPGVASEQWFRSLTAIADGERSNRGPVPYPFFLASPLKQDTLEATSASEWWVEHKWDGIRGQLIQRENGTYLWSRGEELINEQFPELIDMAEAIPADTVLDGEVICWAELEKQPRPFSDLQRRLGRKNVGRKLRLECPVSFVAYDLLESNGDDLRSTSLQERLEQLGDLQQRMDTSSEGWRCRLSSGQRLQRWNQLDRLRQEAVEQGAEGVMLKHLQSPYLSGRKRGHWWKHKRDPMTLDAVLIYAQAGRGRRANLFTDYTFALWDQQSELTSNRQLVTFAKAYSGLNDAEILELDRWIRRHTRERFGPTRSVDPELVFEIGFEGIQASKRHKCGLAVRFPRILRWRSDRTADSANTIEDAQTLCDQLVQRTRST
ncbi:ATP-dependent DNA ligase [Synechococcus sp. BIOS-E4-1]|uniref:ATP-dependent DNA ligase n=1 Tax=Synechococcus sp. BIOS-E4-1 TaxID=1400864 RepID=UPI001646C98C|nr:ATP-dependent DNA ligase [Synechococcus sp. BIOS-E4-1]QNI54862.1 ATP-dependent DNA ligase [Synechococcus sp. BIOS-E4-1]